LLWKRAGNRITIAVLTEGATDLLVPSTAAPVEELESLPSLVRDSAPAVTPRPRLTSVTYGVRAPLLAWLEQEAALARVAFASPRVLDVGCGSMPYHPLFASFAAYLGVDLDNPSANLAGAVESIPVPDAAYDLVLCTQVLEHTLDPAKAVAELWRVTAPGGRVLLSTHGVQVYHPAPVDLWRWTHAGLERLFGENGEWSSITVRPGGGTASCMAMLAATYLDILAQRLHVRWLGKPFVAALNWTGRTIDRHSKELREPRPGALYANYHVVAEKPTPAG
jgi:SAM-dependent methyltransferase